VCPNPTRRLTRTIVPSSSSHNADDRRGWTLVVDELESASLRAYARTGTVAATSIIGLVEARRAAARHGGIDPREMAFALGGFDVIDVDRQIAEAAIAIPPATLRALDAIHVAVAASIGSDLEALVTYDTRMAEAAWLAGLPVVSPGVEAAG
jgi:predicted nucleic acid-binding protein